MSVFYCFSSSNLFLSLILQSTNQIIVESVGIISIASALEQNKSLQRLDLSYCDIDDDGILKLATSLKHSNNTLQNLNIERDPR